MKRTTAFLLCALLLLLAAPALSTEIPEAAKVLTQQRWEGYRVAESSGFPGDEQSIGQIAVVMKKGDHNVLVLLERAAGEAEYRITVETDRALYQGDTVPSLLIDTGGDALFYTYRYDDGFIRSEMYSSVRTESGWGDVGGIFVHAGRDGRIPESMLWTDAGALHHRMLWCSEDDRVLATGETYTMPKDTRGYALSAFDIDTMRADLAAFLAFEGSEGSLLFGTAEIGAGPGKAGFVLEIWGKTEGTDGLPMATRLVVKRGGEVVQQLPAGQTVWLAEDGGLMAGSLSVGDVNFDGYADFCLLRSQGMVNAYYDCWLFDPDQETFFKSDVFSALESNPIFDAGSKQIRCWARDGAADAYDFVYEVRNGDPVLTERTDTHYESATLAQKTLWRLVDGEMRQVRQWTETP